MLHSVATVLILIQLEKVRVHGTGVFVNGTTLFMKIIETFSHFIYLCFIN